MYKAFSPIVIKEMETHGNISLTIKSGWEQVNAWSAKPSHICYWMGDYQEYIFDCYSSQEKTVMEIGNLKATEIISDKDALVDAYMYLTLKGLIDLAEIVGVKRLIVSSYISATADYMLDLGFYVTHNKILLSGGSSGESRGCKTLKE